MSDKNKKSFFNFPATSKLDDVSIQEDDPDFDLLNDETFGAHGISDDDDWEAQHEHLTHEYNKENKKEDKATSGKPELSANPPENKDTSNKPQTNIEAKDEEVDTNGISEQMVQFVLSENDKKEETEPRRDSFIRGLGAHLPSFENNARKNDRWFPWTNQILPGPLIQHPVLPKILTLDEVERDMININKNGNKPNAATASGQPAMARSSSPNRTMPGVQFDYSKLPPPPAQSGVQQPPAPQAIMQVPPQNIIQAQTMNMMNIVQPVRFVMPTVIRRFPPAPPGAVNRGGRGAAVGGGMGLGFMPLSAGRPNLPPQPNQRFPNDDFQRGDGRGRQPAHDFQNRFPNPRGGRGAYHNKPFNSRQQMHQLPRNTHVVDDEYANLMTMNEKHWLTQIHLNQLNTMNPMRDDYYYVTYMNRKQGSSNRKNNNFPGNSRSARETTPKPAYAPTQFENSLGKLQVGSVLAPRKIIDIDMSESVESSILPGVPNAKQLLMEIEKIQNIIIQLEESDASGGACALNPDEASNKIATDIINHNRFSHYMNVNKGRQLLRRLLPHVSNTCPILEKMACSIVFMSKKCIGDSQLLLSYLPYIRSWLNNTGYQQLIDVSDQLISNLPYILTNKFTISVLANMIERAEHLFELNGDNAYKWEHFIKTVVRHIESERARLERPVVGIDPTILTRHLTRTTGKRQDKLGLAIKTLSNAGPNQN